MANHQQLHPTPQPDTDEDTALVNEVAAAVARDYVFPATGRRAAAALRDAHAAGQLASGTRIQLAASVTDVLHANTHDLHLRLLLRADEADDLVDQTAYEAHWAQQARTSAGGVRRVRRLEGNIAEVVLAPFLGLPHLVASWIHSALHLCAGADGVVLDLRECVGGTPDGAVMVCNHFLGPEPVHLIDVTTGEETRQFWSTPTLSPVVPLECPVRVLVSTATFSGGEQLAFTLQDIGRALVVGEQTKGGAHPRVGVRIHDRFELALPVAQPHSPRTGANWEGSGVTPDLPCSAEDALDTAIASLRRQDSR